MDVKHQEELRADFKNLLLELSRTQDALEDASGKKKRSDFYRELERLYFDERFNHYSSDIFIVLKNLQKKSLNGSIDILGQNIEIIRRGYQKKNKDSNGELKDIEIKINKLYDDVSLEISRLLSDEASVWKSSQNNKIKRLDKKIRSSQTKLTEAENKLVEVERKIKSSQKEYIAILGIFAAIVLAFTGGITFSTSVLENIHQSSIYRIILVVSLIGFTLVNILFFLFSFIDKLVRDNNRAISFKPLLVFDISIVFFIGVIIAMWLFGVVELRNREFRENLSADEYSITQFVDIPTKEYETFETLISNND